jgi:hypothetical protein
LGQRRQGALEGFVAGGGRGQVLGLPQAADLFAHQTHQRNVAVHVPLQAVDTLLDEVVDDAQLLRLARQDEGRLLLPVDGVEVNRHPDALHIHAGAQRAQHRDGQVALLADQVGAAEAAVRIGHRGHSDRGAVIVDELDNVDKASVRRVHERVPVAAAEQAVWVCAAAAAHCTSDPYPQRLR